MRTRIAFFRRETEMRQVNGRAAIVAALVLVSVGAVALESGASDPPSSSITVPRTVGQTQTVSWTGTVPAGSIHNSDCNQVQVGTEDTHTVAVQAPAYAKFDAKFEFQITWDARPPLPGGVFNPSDLVLTVNEPGGADPGDTESGEVGSSDGSTPPSGTATETVVGHNLGTGTYTALVCGFTNTDPQPYPGTLTVTTEPKPTILSLTSGATQGLEFGAAV